MTLFRLVIQNRWVRLQHIQRFTSYALQRYLDFCIPRKGIARPQSPFPHSFVCERSIYSHVRPTYFPEKYITRSQKHECRNWDCSRAVPFLEMFVSNFRYCVFAVCVGALRKNITKTIFTHTNGMFLASYILSSM
jgi:hypothetical protein